MPLPPKKPQPKLSFSDAIEEARQGVQRCENLLSYIKSNHKILMMFTPVAHPIYQSLSHDIFWKGLLRSMNVHLEELKDELRKKQIDVLSINTKTKAFIGLLSPLYDICGSYKNKASYNIFKFLIGYYLFGLLIQMLEQYRKKDDEEDCFYNQPLISKGVDPYISISILMAVLSAVTTIFNKRIVREMSRRNSAIDLDDLKGNSLLKMFLNKIDCIYFHLSIYKGALSRDIIERIIMSRLAAFRGNVEWQRDDYSNDGFIIYKFSFHALIVDAELFRKARERIIEEINQAIEKKMLRSEEKETAKKAAVKQLPASGSSLVDILPRQSVLPVKKRSGLSSHAKLLKSAVREEILPSTSLQQIAFDNHMIFDGSSNCVVQPIEGSHPNYYFFWGVSPNQFKDKVSQDYLDVEKKFHEKAGFFAKQGSDCQGVKLVFAGDNTASRKASKGKHDAKIKVKGQCGDVRVFGHVVKSSEHPESKLIVFDTVVQHAHK